MKITLQIEVSNAEELSTIASALGGITNAEVTHQLDTAHVTESASEKTVTEKPKKPRNSKKTATVEAEEMEEVESPFSKNASAADVMAPTQPLVSQEPVVVHQAPVQQQAPQQTVVAQGMPNAVEVITSHAKRLEAATNVPADVKKNVINSLLVEIQAPQGVRASQLPEPFLSIFAQNIGPRVDQVIAQFSNAGLV